MRDQHAELRNKIVETKDLDDASMAALVKAIGEFKAQFAGKQAKGPKPRKRKSRNRQNRTRQIRRRKSRHWQRRNANPRPHPHPRTHSHGQSPSPRQTPQVDPQHPQNHADDGADRHRAIQEGDGPGPRRDRLHEAHHAARRRSGPQRPGSQPSAAWKAARNRAGDPAGADRQSRTVRRLQSAACSAPPSPAGRSCETSGAEVATGSFGQAGHLGLQFSRASTPTGHITHFEDKSRFAEVEVLANRYLEDYVTGRLDRLDVAYMRFDSVSQQAAVVETLLAAGIAVAAADAAAKAKPPKRAQSQAEGPTGRHRSTNSCPRPRASWKRSCRPASR